MSVFARLAAMALLVAPPAGQSAVLLQVTVPSSDGIAELFDSSTLPAFLTTNTVNVRVTGGVFDAAHWDIDGELAKQWWDPMGGGFDDQGNPIPALTGNEYFYSPICDVSPASPGCDAPSLNLALASPTLLRVAFNPPSDSYNCGTVFTGNTADCGFQYRFFFVSYDLLASGASGDVTFTFTDGVPEPASWALMIAGFGLVGATLRRRVALA